MNGLNLLQRSEAKAKGLKYYFTGKPCKHGHVAERTTSNGNCVTCVNITQLQRYHEVYKEDPTQRQKRQIAARNRHKVVGTKWHHEHKERASLLNKQWRERNKEAFAEYAVQWRRDNLDKLTKNAASYRAAKLQATPSWANHEKIQQIYTEAAQRTKETGIEYTVDHTIPLNGETVCGLHVEYNLQVLTRSENSSKGNRL